jgi:hypothetical protein
MVLKLGHWKIDWKYPQSFEIWYWRRMEEINWMYYVKNKKLLHRVREEKNMLYIIT